MRRPHLPRARHLPPEIASRPAVDAPPAGRGGTPLVRVPVAQLDETFIGLQVLITGRGPGGRQVAIFGGVSDVARCVHLDAPPGAVPFTTVWVGGQTVIVRDDAVIVAEGPREHPHPTT